MEQVGGGDGSAAAAVETTQLSKSAQKRIAARARKAQYEKEKKLDKKKKLAESKKRKADDNINNGGDDAAAAPQKKLTAGAAGAPREKPSTPYLAKAAYKEQLGMRRLAGQRIVVDLDFDEHMNDGCIASLSTQLAHAYAANAKSSKPTNLHLTSVNKRIAAKLDTIVGFSHWRVEKTSKHYLELFDKSELVYLTADSSVTLQTFDPKDVYVIGGLVDHNNLKGHTANLAAAHGIRTAKLPIADGALKSRKVLAVNHVVEMLISYHEHGDWNRAMEAALPQRKMAKKTPLATVPAARNPSLTNPSLAQVEQ